MLPICAGIFSTCAKFASRVVLLAIDNDGRYIFGCEVGSGSFTVIVVQVSFACLAMFVTTGVFSVMFLDLREGDHFTGVLAIFGCT